MSTAQKDGGICSVPKPGRQPALYLSHEFLLISISLPIQFSIHAGKKKAQVCQICEDDILDHQANRLGACNF